MLKLFGHIFEFGCCEFCRPLFLLTVFHKFVMASCMQTKLTSCRFFIPCTIKCLVAVVMLAAT